MDKIWYRNPSKSEVIGQCGGDEKIDWPRRTDKSRTLNKNAFGNTRSLTGDWTRDHPYSKQTLLPLGYIESSLCETAQVTIHSGQYLRVSLNRRNDVEDRY